MKPNFNTLLWISLCLALIGSVNQLASVFASVDGNIYTGWIKAIAIDLGLIAIAYNVRRRKATRRPTRWPWLLLVVFTLISIYGNYIYAAVSELSLFDFLTPIVLSASLPILVLGLMEVVSDDIQHGIKKAARDEKKRHTEKNLTTPVEVARQKRQDKATERQTIAREMSGNGHTVDDIANELDVTTRTVERYLNGKRNEATS